MLLFALTGFQNFLANTQMSDKVPKMKNDKAEATNRRVFIKRSAGVGTVAALNSLPIGQTAAAEPSGKKTKVGVIGCGSVANKYLPHLKSSPFVELVSTCDIIPQRSKKAAMVKLRSSSSQKFSHDRGKKS